jgi:hypothetical protein
VRCTAPALDDGDFYARYVPTGHILFARSDTLLAMRFELETLTAGDPVTVLEGLATDDGESFAGFAVAQAGSYAFRYAISGRVSSS